MEKHVLLKIFILIFFMVSFSSCLQPELPLSEQLQKALDENLKDFEVKGVFVAIIMPEREIWLGTSGISHHTVTIKPDMLFAIGSITKNIVAALTLQLVEEGMLSLEDPLDKWFPSYPKVDRAITIRQLLNHTSGLYMF
jgi:D-alanyl-D-alanine carboxypeptidase